MTRTSLTDRYVWAVTRQLPPETGPDVARELRVTIEETVENRVAAGEDPESAERETVAGLGDPDVLAREYGGRPNHLIGPAYFPAWVRLVKLLLAVIVPLAVLGTVVGQAFVADAGFGTIVGEVVGIAVQVSVHIVFWTAVVFVLVERQGGSAEPDQFLRAWNPDELSDPADGVRRASLSEMVHEVVTSVVVIGLCLWQWGGAGEGAVQVLDPELAPGWQVLILGFLALDVLVTVAAWARGGWSTSLALAGVISAVVSGAVLVWLVLSDQLLTDLPQELNAAFGWDADWSISVPAVAIGVVIVFGWEAVTSLRRMRATGDDEPAQ